MLGTLTSRDDLTAVGVTGVAGVPDARRVVRRPVRQITRAALVLLAVNVIVLGAVVPAALILHPDVDRPYRADAVVSLSGGGKRIPRAMQLMTAEAAPVLVLAGTPDGSRHVELCRTPQPFTVMCVQPNPDSTRAEARATARLARQHRWESLVLVTDTYHATRARLLFDRCFDGKLSVVAARETPTLRGFLHEWGALLYAMVRARAC